ncbi:MAG: class I tRNA ligase family protein, partial [Pseudomonadota bacterium]
YHWLENIEPWCISRQLWWGHQIPVWYSLHGKTAQLDMACGAQKDEALKHFQWWDAPETDRLGYRTVADRNEAIEWNAKEPHRPAVWRDPDVLDTWFSSGLWPIGTLGWPEDTPELQKYFPTSTLVTGSDILFFWVARMMMMQYAVVGERPFDTVYLHGLVRDAKGKKMSKSTGNVIDPLDIIDEFGADALRFSSAAMAALGGVLKLDMERIKGYRNFGTKLWNACRFAEMNGVYEVLFSELPQPEAAVNRWIVGETAKVRETVDAALDGFRFNDAANALYAFVWGKVCDWYLELSKPLLQGDDAEKAAETKEVMRWVLDQCLILLHPIMPFITEELWGTLAARDKMLVHADWPNYAARELVNAEADAELNWVIGLIEGIRSARAQMHVPAGAYIPMVFSGLSDDAQAYWAANETMIKRLARIEDLQSVETFPKGTVTLGIAGGNFGLPLADVIDVAEEKTRLEKTLSKLAKELGGLRGRLNNPKFAESAPEEVVEETRANLAAREEEESKLKQALDRLSELA